jgi:tetratricopeptide (TPR) repeat protein
MTSARAWMPVVIAAVTVVAFCPVLGNQFVIWGDQADLLSNPHFRGFLPDNLVWMFTTILHGHYQPLSWLTFALDYSIWGMDARGYHLSSLLLHAACAVAVFFLIVDLITIATPRLDREAEKALPWAAMTGALLFAVHPLRVEVVAWATERRGSLSGLLLVLSVTMYLRYARGRSVDSPDRPAAGLAFDRHYWLAVLFFALSLLSKELGFTLPVVLLVLDVYPLRRWRAGALVEKAPFIALTLAAMVVAARDSAALARSLSDYTLSQRVAQCFYGLAFYLQKTVVPARLSPLYPIPLVLDPLAPRFVISAAVVTAFTIGLVLLRRRRPAPLTAWACAVILLSPVLGLVQSGPQIAADRYTYLPAVGLSAIVAAWLTQAWTRRAQVARALSGALACVILAGLAGATWRQSRVWRDSETLWRHAVEIDPSSVAAHNDLGAALVQAGRLDEAAAQFELAVTLDPGMADAHYNLAVIRAAQGRLGEAITHWRAVLAINPQDQETQAYLRQALEKYPDQ